MIALGDVVIVVDFAALENMVHSIERTLAETESTLESLAGSVDRLVGMWAGSAAEGFQRTVAEWTNGQQDLRAQLAALRDLVETAHDNHADALAANIAMWRV